jgi:hypothetical protein
MKGLSKSRILVHRQCPKRLWLHTFRPELEEDEEGVTARLAAGTQVGEVARSLHAHAQLIEGDTLDEALSLTQQALKSSPRRPLCEATFEHNKVLVRADLLLPVRNGYDLVEVKSSTGVKDYHYEDAAVQAWVVRRAGVKVPHVQIAHIDKNFVYPGNAAYQGLFVHSDITPDVHALSHAVPGWIKAARHTLAGDEPDIEPGAQCHTPFDCPFMAYCSPASAGEEDGYPPEILPRGKQVAADLRAVGYHDLRDVPDGYFANEKYERIRHASVTGQALLDPQAGKILKGCAYPRYYLDFETIQFAVPLWTGTRPYQQLPFQWSCHRESANGKLQADGYLASDAGDPRRAFVDSLLACIGPRGPIFVYQASFERSRLQELIDTFPELEDPIDALCDRMVDLLPMARDYYYHPAMRGSWSIKAVLPTIAPELSYSNLAVGDGTMAQQAYVEMLLPETTVKRREEIRNSLLAYCNQDTLALVRLVRFFQGT